MYQEARQQDAVSAAACVESFMFDGVSVSSEPLVLDPPANDILGWPANDVHPAVGAAESRIKRSMDVSLSVLLLIFLAPLLLAVSLLIVLDSRGPVFFRQRRTGLDGQVFRIFKFRTMAVCEDGDAVLQAVRGDRRVTRVGRLLRQSSIDELPQLFNVIRGDMSLIGPRPHALAHDQKFRACLPGYDLRFGVRPGITGLAQVRGLRGETASLRDAANRLAADLEYVRDWSVRRDLVILARSAGALFRHQGY